MNTKLGLLAAAMVVAACAGAPAPTASPSPSPSPPPSPSPAPTPSPSPSAESGFYLRAWYTQALPPLHTFAWLPPITIADGLLFDGNVAIPMIFPGPLTIVPIVRPISDDGITAIIDEADQLGLLGDTTDFSGDAAMPGARLGQIELVIDGQRRVLTGKPDAVVRCGGARCIAEPGTPGAFAAFWQNLTLAQGWLGAELGPAIDYQPDRVALLLTAPSADNSGLAPAPVAWPFETALAEAGVAYPSGEGDRCVTLSGDALVAVWPDLLNGNQLTVFVDQAGGQAAPIVRVLVPGDESPCPDTQ